DLLNKCSDIVANGSRVEGASKNVDMIADGSKDVRSSNTATVDLTHDSVDITSDK
ncbi:hypothetical protein A2U01_0065409, partial [Trifolium medium]|nr:hypothetical protein [Trifolium medium]